MSTQSGTTLTSRILGRWQAQDIAPLVSLAVLLVFFAVASDSLLRPNTVVQVLKQGSVLAIVSVGLTFVLLCAEIDLAVGMIALWTACLCGYLFELPFAAGPGGSGDATNGAV